MEKKVNHRFGSKAWFGANWKNILIILLACFSLNKCTQSCNRSTKIDKLETQIAVQDSTIQATQSQVSALVRDTADYANQIRMYKGFGSQTDAYIRQRNVTDSINAANAAKQKAQTDALIRQNRELINKQNNK